MSHKRHNKANRVGGIYVEQEWFKANVRRQRRRRDIAFESRRRNRNK